MYGDIDSLKTASRWQIDCPWGAVFGYYWLVVTTHAQIIALENAGRGPFRTPHNGDHRLLLSHNVTQAAKANMP